MDNECLRSARVCSFLISQEKLYRIERGLLFLSLLWAFADAFS